jgi:hypothetical protein
VESFFVCETLRCTIIWLASPGDLESPGSCCELAPRNL